jgi:hypothetical protein
MWWLAVAELAAVRALVALHNSAKCHAADGGQNGGGGVEPPGSVTVRITKPGSLGISFSSHGEAEPPVITAIKPGTPGYEHASLTVGLVLRKVQGAPVRGFKHAIDQITASSRPLTLTFEASSRHSKSAINQTVGDHADEWMEPPGPEAGLSELSLYKEWVMLVNEPKRDPSDSVDASQRLLPTTARQLLQRLAAFFHDDAMQALWIPGAKMVMSFVNDGAASTPPADRASEDLRRAGQLVREAGIAALEHTLRTAGASHHSSDGAPARTSCAPHTEAPWTPNHWLALGMRGHRALMCGVKHAEPGRMAEG